MLISWLPILVLILGALVYALAANPKAAEMGRLAFAIGLAVAVLAFAGHQVRL